MKKKQIKLLASNDPHPAKNTSSSSWPSWSSSLVISIDSFSDITIDTLLKFLLTCSLTCLLTSNWRFYWHSYWHLHWHFVDMCSWRSHWHLLLACSLTFSWALTLTFCLTLSFTSHWHFYWHSYSQVHLHLLCANAKSEAKIEKALHFSSKSLNKCMF